MKLFSLISCISLSISASASAANDSSRVAKLEREVSELRQKVHELNHQINTLAKSPPPARPSNHGQNYRIRRGDTFWRIAKKYGVSMTALRAANPGINPRRLRIGAHLTLPGGGGSSTNHHPKAGGGSYRVRSGDTLSGIASRLKIPLKDLRATNRSVNPRRLQIGQMLMLPGQQQKIASVAPKPAKSERPSVKPAKKNTPAPPTTPPLPPKVAAAATGPSLQLNGPRLVTISENRRLDEIAQFYGTDVETINQLNNVTLSPAQMIKVGSQIYIPKQ